ncbi:MAG TPA: hypothetical protein VK013_14315 [Myxococcaceae bacterium]|nr:hypothetical protein [Myxococcaceae bacterium]
MRHLLIPAFGLLLLTIQAVVLQNLGAQTLRVEVGVVLVAFLSLRATRGAGATAAFALGYLTDFFTGRPTGLYTFLAVLLFLLGRLIANVVEVRTPIAFALYAAAATTMHGLLAGFFVWLTSKGPGTAAMFSALPGQVLLTGVFSLLLFPLLRKMDPGTARPEVGALR